MKEEILEIFDNSFYLSVSEGIGGKDKAAEEIVKLYNSRNCGNCRYLVNDHWGIKCTCHELYMQNEEIIKCNDWEGK
ncbi:MAG TPA: hypothetical protein VHO03_05790 [Ignavibacteriales bacterium]|nr:hypothetical protein [Ignavibacteriales bacterium]